MFKGNSSEPPDAARRELENLLVDHQNPGRFQVAKVDVENGVHDGHLDSLQPHSNQASYNVYDSRRGQLTSEVPPRDEHYRERTSVQYAYRPTLEELHRGGGRAEKVS